MATVKCKLVLDDTTEIFENIGSLDLKEKSIVSGDGGINYEIRVIKRKINDDGDLVIVYKGFSSGVN